MSDSMLKLQILVRAELAISQIRARRAASRSALFLVAMIFALLGLGMLNLAGYHYLSTSVGPALAALLMALANSAIAVVVLLLSSKAGPSENEEKLAQEMRDLAYTELSNDIEQFKTELGQITADVRRIRSGFTSFAGGAASGIAPLLGMLIKAVKPK